MKRRKNGFALIVTLAVIVLLTVLVVGMLNSIKLDRDASRSSLSRTRAELAADWGVDEVVSLLRQVTANTNIGWASQPGRLVYSASSANPVTRLIFTNEILLSSGEAAAAASGVFAPANLNTRMFENGGSSGMLAAGTNGILLRWIYIRQDGSVDTNTTPDLGNTANPIVARCAYWADDDATRLNVNLAWRRDQPTAVPGSDPTLVSLKSLSDAVVDPIRNQVTTRPFNSLLEARQAGQDVQDAIADRKFDVTHYNAVPLPSGEVFWLTTDVNLMNSMKTAGIIREVKRASNTASATSGLPNFIDIRTSPEKDPGYLPNIWDSGGNAFRLNKSIIAIRTQLLRTDWPSMPGKSLIEKWYGSSLSATEKNLLAEQVAMNIIDYVRLRESSAKLAPPIAASRASLTAAASTFSFTSFRTGNNLAHYLGGTSVGVGGGTQVNNTSGKWLMAGRAPLITEITMVVADTPVTKAGAGYVGTQNAIDYSNVSGDYWPQSTDMSLGGEPGSQISRQWKTNVTVPEVELYRCKVYVEIYLPAYEGLPSNFEIDFGATGFAAWPDGEAGLPPEEVFSRAGIGSKSLQTDASWFMGLPDEVSTFPNNLRIDTGKVANTNGISTDMRNFITYYFLNKDATKVGAATFGSPFTYNYARQPLGLENYAIPPIRSTEFMGGNGKLRPGGRIVIAKEFFRTGSPTVRPRAKMRVSLAFGAMTDFYAQPNMSISAGAAQPLALAIAPYWEPVEIDVQTASDANLKTNNLPGVKSLQINDPFLGFDPAQWKWEDQSLGVANPGSELGKSPTVASARQDTDSDGKVSGYSVLQTAPFAGSSGSRGRLDSLAELGLIHTGMSPVAGKSVPWRSLRLQPDPANTTNDVPDWALLDAFAIPPADIGVTNVSKLRVPNALARGGQVNVNATLAPTNMTSNLRVGGLAGLLAGARKDSTNTFTPAEAAAVAENVASQILADGDYQGRSFGLPGIFDTPAEVLEIKGVADRGEESENTVRDILALAANRSNVFTVFSIGQALKQTPKGTLLVMAEKRRQVTLERVETVSTATTPVKSETKFRTVYSRDLHP